MIHKYAKTQEDKDKLKEVIGLKAVEATGEYKSNWDIESFYNSGFVAGKEEGIEQGGIAVALKFKDELGIDEAVRISGFSREILENYP